MIHSPERPVLLKQPALGHPRPFPNPVACFAPYLIFTTLSPSDAWSHSKIPFCHPETHRPCKLVCLDDCVGYIPFSSDFGPLNLAHIFESMSLIHQQLVDREEEELAVCIYTKPEPQAKANMALLVALYMMILHRREPWEAYSPLMGMELVAFRDAGASPADYGLSIQECLYGFGRAYINGLIGLQDFDKTDYEFHERVENGDLNVLGPFVPFASPTESGWVRGKNERTLRTRHELGLAGGPLDPKQPKGSLKDNHAFTCVLKKFKEENVGMVVRLNEPLYDRRHFVDAGMEHVEMYFDDGTNPSEEMVREFIRISEEVIGRRKQKVAVHCRAGLGRTGVLIGAYLIYKHGFSANEAISAMRIVRPGMVVGPQQQYMMANQFKWSGWAVEDELRREIKKEGSNPLLTPSSECDSLPPSSPSFEAILASTPLRSITLVNSERTGSTSEPTPKAVPRPLTPSPPRALPSRKSRDDAVGQPRKGNRPIRGEPYSVLEVPVEEARPPTSTIARQATEPSELPLRGVKRGSTRIPVPKATPIAAASMFSPSVRGSLVVAQDIKLGRHSSTASTASLASELDDRLPKRRIPSASERLPAYPITSASAPASRTPSPVRQRPELVPTYSETQLSARQSMILPRRVLQGSTRSAPFIELQSPPKSKVGCPTQPSIDTPHRAAASRQMSENATPKKESSLSAYTPTRLGGLVSSWARTRSTAPTRQ